MADNSPIGSWVYALGGLEKSGKKTKICKAFAKAVRDWCDGKPNTIGRQFADVLFNRLGGVGKMWREVAILTIGWGAKAVAVGVLETVATGSPSGAQKIAMKILEREAEEDLSAPARIGGMLTDKNRYTKGMIDLAVEQGGGKYGLNFADGQFSDGQLLEIKSPMDEFQPGQAERYNAASMQASQKPLAVADCTSCKKYIKCPSAKACKAKRDKVLAALRA
jgi:hypothetical protein